MKTYRLIRAEKATFPIAFMSLHLGVFRSGYHAWAGRPPSARAVATPTSQGKMVRIHTSSRATYAARIHAELTYEGRRVGRKRVTRLMKRAHIQRVHVRRRYPTTMRAARIHPAPDLLLRSPVGHVAPHQVSQPPRG